MSDPLVAGIHDHSIYGLLGPAYITEGTLARSQCCRNDHDTNKSWCSMWCIPFAFEQLRSIRLAISTVLVRMRIFAQYWRSLAVILTVVGYQFLHPAYV